MEKLIRQLEEDGQNVLEFMASNGLVANPKTTALIILNSKSGHNESIEINIGKEKIHQQSNAELLGKTFEDTLNEISGSDRLKSTYINDGAKAWNLTPQVIKDCKSLYMAKKEIKKFVKTLPV